MYIVGLLYLRPWKMFLSNETSRGVDSTAHKVCQSYLSTYLIYRLCVRLHFHSQRVRTPPLRSITWVWWQRLSRGCVRASKTENTITMQKISLVVYWTLNMWKHGLKTFRYDIKSCFIAIVIQLHIPFDIKIYYLIAPVNHQITYK